MAPRSTMPTRTRVDKRHRSLPIEALVLSVFEPSCPNLMVFVEIGAASFIEASFRRNDPRPSS
jgi:hypothetical protein